MANNVTPTIDECRWAKHYKAVYPPRCNDGNPCHECRRKWRDAQMERLTSKS